MENWEEVIIDSTNEKYAVEMIIKLRDHKTKYKKFDVDSVAAQFAELSPKDKAFWAYRMTAQQIGNLCRDVRRMNSMADDAKRERERNPPIIKTYYD